MSEKPKARASSASQDIHLGFRFQLSSTLSLLDTLLWLPLTLREKLGIQALKGHWGQH